MTEAAKAFEEYIKKENITGFQIREPGTHPRAGARVRPSISAPAGSAGPFSGLLQVAFDSQKIPINI